MDLLHAIVLTLAYIGAFASGIILILSLITLFYLKLYAEYDENGNLITGEEGEEDDIS